MFKRFKTAKWIAQHQFFYEHWSRMPQDEFDRIKKGLLRFHVSNPEVSIVIPVWNESANIVTTLSSFAEMNLPCPTELILVNNNSSDDTTIILDALGVRYVNETRQGIAHARLRGLEEAKGKYHLCGDGDALYPPNWISKMIEPMQRSEEIKCVYGRYSFLPEAGASRFSLGLYELFAEFMADIRSVKREFINVRGFNMAFRTDEGREVEGFNMPLTRSFDSDPANGNYVVYGEDGRMGRKMSEIGKLYCVNDYAGRVWSSPRRLMKDGSIFKAYINRLKHEGSKILEYLFASKKLKHTTDDLFAKP